MSKQFYFVHQINFAAKALRRRPWECPPSAAGVRHHYDIVTVSSFAHILVVTNRVLPSDCKSRKRSQNFSRRIGQSRRGSSRKITSGSWINVAARTQRRCMAAKSSWSICLCSDIFHEIEHFLIGFITIKKSQNHTAKPRTFSSLIWSKFG